MDDTYLSPPPNSPKICNSLGTRKCETKRILLTKETRFRDIAIIVCDNTQLQSTSNPKKLWTPSLDRCNSELISIQNAFASNLKTQSSMEKKRILTQLSQQSRARCHPKPQETHNDIIIKQAEAKQLCPDLMSPALP